MNIDTVKSVQTNIVSPKNKTPFIAVKDKNEGSNVKELCNCINKQPVKDIFILSFGSTAGLTDSAQKVIPDKEDSLTYRRIYTNIKFNMAQLNKKDYTSGLIRQDLDKLPKCPQHDFINEVIDCLMNLPEEELYTSRGQDGPFMNSTGCFLLKTCENLILLEASSYKKSDQSFIEQLDKDIETSKHLIEIINSDKYEIL